MQIAVDWKHPPSIGPGGEVPLRGGIIVDDVAHTTAAAAMMQKLAKSGTDDNNQVTLVECLESFTRAEELEDGAW